MKAPSSPQKPARNKLFTLKDVVNYPARIISTLGVVMDCTSTYRTNDSYDYVTKLKVIDNTFNPKQRDKIETEPYIFIFIYTKTRAEAPQIRRIGDIVLLKGFNFENYQEKDKKFVKGNYNKSASEWQLFDGRANASTINSIARSRSIPSTVLRDEADQLRRLREWSATFFVNNSLYDLCWYQSEFPAHLIPEHIYELKDVDLIVRVLGDVKVLVNGAAYHKLVFADERKNMYFGELQNSNLELEIGSVVKLRSICVFLHNNSRKVEFFNYSSVLQLQSTFKDATAMRRVQDTRYSQEALENQFFEELHLDKYQKEQISHNVYLFTSGQTKSGKKVKLNVTENFPELERYDLSEVELPGKARLTQGNNRVASIVLKDHADLPVTPLKTLANSLEQVRRSPVAYNRLRETFFKVRVSIKEVGVKTLKDFAKLYSPSKNRIWEFDELEDAKLSTNDLKVIFYMVLNCSDNSLDSSGATLPLHLVTYDGNPENIFDLWKLLPDALNLSSWFSLPASTSKKAAGLVRDLADEDAVFDFVVSVVVNGDKENFFRIVDSMFWFHGSN